MSAPSSEVLCGECECGTAVTREIATGYGAEILNSLPLRCQPCLDQMEEAEEARASDEQRQARERLAHERAQTLPRALQSVDLDRLDRAGCGEAIDAARRWAICGDRGLLLVGPFGVGKTTIAAGAMLVRFACGGSGVWASAPLLLARLGSGLGTPQREAALTVLTGTRPLVLDDLDKTRPTEYGAEQIFLAIDGAVTEERALLVTTNLRVSELAAKWPAPFGEAIASRLAGYCDVVVLSGGDRRLRGPS
jgi:DNA replication protein DnaC